MRIRNWYSRNTESIMGFCTLMLFSLLPACFILIGIRAENVYDRGLALFVGAGLIIPLIVVITSIVESKRGSRR